MLVVFLVFVFELFYSEMDLFCMSFIVYLLGLWIKVIIVELFFIGFGLIFIVGVVVLVVGKF